MKRENGFYWVKIHGIWEVAEWIRSEWWLTGFDHEVCGFYDGQFERIDENRIINPNEK